MKKSMLFTVVIAYQFICGLNVYAQSEVSKGAEIEFKKEIHDYGEIEYGADGNCVFEFKNTGIAPLIISDAKKSCGCTVPEWPKEPIAPGERAFIKVRYDTKRPGGINKTVTIISNAVNSPSKIIRIKGSVKPKIEIESPVNSSGPRN